MAQPLQIPNLGRVRPLRREDDQRRQWSPVRSLDFPDWFKEAFDRISELGKLQEGWDSFGALPVSSGAISRARLLLSNLQVEDLPRPHIAAIPDGSVGLHWRVAERDLEIEVEPSGSPHCLRTVVGKGPMEPEDVHNFSEVQHALNWIIGR